MSTRLGGSTGCSPTPAGDAATPAPAGCGPRRQAHRAYVAAAQAESARWTTAATTTARSQLAIGPRDQPSTFDRAHRDIGARAGGPQGGVHRRDRRAPGAGSGLLTVLGPLLALIVCAPGLRRHPRPTRGVPLMRTRVALAAVLPLPSLAARRLLRRLVAAAAAARPRRRPPPAPGRPARRSTPPATRGPACAPPARCPRRARCRPAATWPTIQKRGRLILGTSQDTLLFSSRNPFTGKVEGFDVDMGRQIAAGHLRRPRQDPDQGHRVRQAGPRTPQDGTVDLVADTMTINCARWKDVNFSTDLLRRRAEGAGLQRRPTAKGIEDLGGKKVCAAAGCTSIDNIAKARRQADRGGRPRLGPTAWCCSSRTRSTRSPPTTRSWPGWPRRTRTRRWSAPVHRRAVRAWRCRQEHPEFTRFVNGVLAQNPRRRHLEGDVRASGSATSAPPPQPPAAEYR